MRQLLHKEQIKNLQLAPYQMNKRESFTIQISGNCLKQKDRSTSYIPMSKAEIIEAMTIQQYCPNLQMSTQHRVITKLGKYLKNAAVIKSELAQYK